MNFNNLLYTDQAQTSSTEQLTPDAMSLKRALQGALQMWGICISEELKPGGQTEVNTLGSSPRSVANQLMMEMTTELWPQLLCVTSSQGTCPYRCHVTVQKNVCSNKPKLPLLHEESWLFFHYHIGWHKNIPTFKTFTAEEGFTCSSISQSVLSTTSPCTENAPWKGMPNPKPLKTIHFQLQNAFLMANRQEDK